MKTTILPNKASFILHCFLLLGVLAAIMLCYPDVYDDYDMWWHLKYGEHFVQQHTWLIDHQAFSWSPTIADWKYVSWLSDSLMYIIFSLFSFTGLYSIQIFSLLAIYCMYLYYLKTVGDSLNILHILSLFLVSFTIYELHVKPELFSVFFFAAVVFIFIQSKTASKPLFYLYPLLFMLWVNIHGVFIFGIFLITILFSLELLNFGLLKKSPLPVNLLKALALSVALSYLALLINPYGIGYHLSILHDLFISDYMNYSSNIQAFGDVWSHLFPANFDARPSQTAWFMVIMMAVFVIVNAYVYVKTKKVDPPIIAVNILFFVISMSAGRAKYYFPLIWLFSMPYLYRHVRTWIDPLRSIRWIALILLIYFSFVNIYFTIRYVPKLSWFGMHITDCVPEKEIVFIKEHHLPGPFFNDYLTGGYMIWSLYPEYKVFIDPRYGPYVNGALSDWFDLESRLTPAELQRMTTKYGFKAALLNLRQTKIIFWLLHTPDWKLVYFDKYAAVIVHQSVYSAHEAEFRSIDLGPSRFNNVTDPSTLTKLFWTYANFARDPIALNAIMAIYQKNVRDSYALKERDMEMMEIYVEATKKMPVSNKPRS